MHIFALRLAVVACLATATVTSADEACNGPSSWTGGSLNSGSSSDGSVVSGVSTGSSVKRVDVGAVTGSTGSDLSASGDHDTGSSGACSGPNARTKPPMGATVVDATGAYNGSYLTVSEGVANIPNTTEEHMLFVFPGVYEEQVTVPKFNGPLVLQGYTCNTMQYSENQVTITHKMVQKDLPANMTNARNQLVSTVVFKSKKDVKTYNLNIANPEGKLQQLGQAVAVYVDNTDYGFYACNFTGYQDTLCANKGKELYARTYISGAVDFIFGLQSKAWFESCDLESVGNGCVTANGNSNSSNLSEYVFNNARVFSTNASMNGTAYLGRPWYPYSRVVFQNCQLGDVISPQG
ncbi:hypothetical protein PI125_g14673 [Phytophthora idaei]|nr:hypothetical protein PI125_g14673 [Phytophthora idaei]